MAEDFGAIFTGQGTDPNSGLLLIVLAAAFWRPASGGPRSREYEAVTSHERQGIDMSIESRTTAGDVVTASLRGLELGETVLFAGHAVARRFPGRNRSAVTGLDVR